VLQKLIPRQFFGVGPGGIHNLRLVLQKVDRFVKLRRFESLSLHEVCKGIKVCCPVRSETDSILIDTLDHKHCLAGATPGPDSSIRGKIEDLFVRFAQAHGVNS
jgi:hypothetical protein